MNLENIYCSKSLVVLQWWFGKAKPPPPACYARGEVLFIFRTFYRTGVLVCSLSVFANWCSLLATLVFPAHPSPYGNVPKPPRQDLSQNEHKRLNVEEM